MFAGISRSMIFSKRVLLIEFSLFDHQSEFALAWFRAETLAKVRDDLFFQVAATDIPAPGARQAFDTTAQAAKTDDAWRGAELTAQLFAQTREENQLGIPAELVGQ